MPVKVTHRSIPDRLWRLQTYEEFKEAVRTKFGAYPSGTEMLEYMHRHPDESRVYFKNSVWKESNRPKDPPAGRSGVRA